MSAGRAPVTDAVGFLGHHPVSYLVTKGHQVRCADQQRPRHTVTGAHDFLVAGLRYERNRLAASEDVDERNNRLMNLCLLEAVRQGSVGPIRYWWNTSCTLRNGTAPIVGDRQAIPLVVTRKGSGRQIP